MDKLNILIKNGSIIDGTGNPRYSSDIIIHENKILSIHNSSNSFVNIDGTNYVTDHLEDKWAHHVCRWGDGSVLDESGSYKADYWINGNKVFGTTQDPNISGIQYFNRLPINTTNLYGNSEKPGNADRFEGRMGMFRF